MRRDARKRVQVVTALMTVLLIALIVCKGHIPTRAEAGYEPLFSLTRVGDLPYPLMRMPAATGPDGNIYIFGGEAYGKGIPCTAHDEILRFDPRTNSTTVVARMPTTRVYSAAASANGKIYVFGGYQGFTCPPTSSGPRAEGKVLEFDPISNTVTNVTDPSIESVLPYYLRMATAATAADGQVYVFAGNDVYTFDPITYKVKKLPYKSPASFYEALAVASFDGRRIYLFYGPGVYEFDVASQSFTSNAVVASWGRYREELAGAVSRNGKIYTFAGHGSPNAPGMEWKEVFEFDPSTYELKVVAELPYGVAEIFSAGVGPDYKIYAFGGHNVSGYYTTRDIWRLDIGIDLSADLLEIQTDGVGSHPALLKATVTNHGVTDTAFAVRVRFLDGSCSPTTGKVLGDAVIPKIDPGGTATATLQVPLRTKGVHNLCALVDPDNEIKEGSEDNNWATAQATVLWVGENLVPAVTATPRSVPEGTPVSVEVTIENTGDYPADPSAADVLVNGQRVHQQPVPRLEPGASYRFSLSLPTDQPPVVPESTNWIDAVADATGVLWETNEEDNRARTDVFVHERARLEVRPSDAVRIGSPVEVYAKWCGLEDVQIDLTALGGGVLRDSRTCASRTETLPAPKPGIYPICLTGRASTGEIVRRCVTVGVWDVKTYLVPEEEPAE